MFVQLSSEHAERWGRRHSAPLISEPLPLLGGRVARSGHEPHRRSVASPGAALASCAPLGCKIERFHRTLLEEWAYIRPRTSEARRHSAYDGLLHHHRHHRSLGWLTPNATAQTIGDNRPRRTPC